MNDKVSTAAIDEPTKETKMRRPYLSQIFQDVDGTYGIPGAWHHRFQTYRKNVETGEIDQGPPAVGYVGVEYLGGEIAPPDGEGNRPASLLVLVAAIDHTPFQDDAALVPVPVVGLGSKIESVGTTDKLIFRSAVANLGHESGVVDSVTANPSTMREVLNYFGKLNNPEFDADNFDLFES